MFFKERGHGFSRVSCCCLAQVSCWPLLHKIFALGFNGSLLQDLWHWNVNNLFTDATAWRDTALCVDLSLEMTMMSMRRPVRACDNCARDN